MIDRLKFQLTRLSIIGFSIVAMMAVAVSDTIAAQRVDSEKHSFSTEVLLDSLDHPWGMDFLPDGRLLITGRSGRLHVTSVDFSRTIEISGLPDIHEHGQGGLLDVLVHPDFDNNQYIYLSLARDENGRYGSEVIRARLDTDANRLEETETIFVARPKVRGTRHFGSRLLIDPGGYLFISLGDRGQREQAQHLDSHLGSLIRLRDDGSIPEDNPFANTPGALPEIFSHGHRNIQGLALRQSDQSLWLHEHGPQGGDELNRPEPGRNYGWPVITYGVNYVIGTSIGEGTHKRGMEQPVYYWDPSIAPSGLTFYESARFPEWNNSVFIGSLKFSTLVRLELNGNEVVHEERMLENEFGRIRDVQVGPDGLVYLLTDEANGKLIRLEPID